MPAFSLAAAQSEGQQQPGLAAVPSKNAGDRVGRDVCDLIGRTPLLHLNKVTEGCEGSVIAKLEGMEVASSVKDRIGRAMIAAAEERGDIQPGVSTLVCPTGGNTGIAVATAARVKGYRCILVMPHSMSMERRIVMRALGAEVVLVDMAAGGFQVLLDKSDQLLEETPNSYLIQQWEDPANPRIHYETTGPEVWAGTGGDVDILVAGVGTGGTLCGTGKFLREQNPAVQLVAVEPAESAVMSGGQPGPHNIQGIGAGFIPKTCDMSLIDEVIPVTTADALAMARRIALEEAVLVGISSGAAAMAAIQLAKRPENKGKRIVVIFPSCGERYLSTELFDAAREEAEAMVVSC